MSLQATPGGTVVTPIINTPGGSNGSPSGQVGLFGSSAPTGALGVAKAMSPFTSPMQPSPGSPRHHPSGSMDVESLIRSHGGDVRRTLDAIVNDRNSLQAQNTQLWKLIEKQRAQCAHLAADNDRLRADRERANGRLVSAGLEPVTAPNRRVPHSASAMALGSGSHESGRRLNVDGDDKASTGSAAAAIPNRSASETSTPGEPISSNPPSGMPPSSASENSGLVAHAQTTLLPSPMPEKRLRHESRMTFPPEVASFMALADQKDQQLSNSFIPENAVVGSDVPTGYTTSPGESARASPIAELSEELTSTSPRPSQDTVTSRPPMSPATDARPSIESTTLITPPAAQQIPDHMVLTPALLPHARLSIPHSSVYPNQSGRDVLCFIVQVQVRPPNSTQPLQWTVGKTFSAFMELDQRTQERSGKNRKDWKRMVAPLPEGKAWKDFAPSKIDQRKVALEHYLESLLVAPVSDKSDLCNFLSTDVVQTKLNQQRKEGYLTKKGKNFGGWKTRYFILDGPVMKYYESRGGTYLGTITITGAQIGRQNRAPDSSDERNFRHAFLIIEASSRRDQNRHVLCAGSDMERDSWIEMLVRQVEPEPPAPAPVPAPAPAPAPVVQSPPPQNASGPPNAMSAQLGHQRRRSAIRKSSKDVVVTSAKPMSQMPDANAKFISGAPLPSVINLMESQRSLHTTAGQTPSREPSSSSAGGPGHPLTTVTSGSGMNSADIKSQLSSPIDGPTPKPTKRQSAMPVRQSFSPAYLSKLSNDGISSVPGYPVDRDRDRKAKSGRFWGFGKAPPEKGAATRPVFGIPLPDSLAIASVAGLPAIVFRCIEYLESKQADQEEGIYRLSGSSAVIKGLKERFNHEGDVNLLQMDERWDPHAIAGLLKTYLRELPTSLLTRELHIRFLAVIGELRSPFPLHPPPLTLQTLSIRRPALPSCRALSQSSRQPITPSYARSPHT